MNRIDRLLAAGPTLSYEFFPPRTEAGVEQLSAALADLAESAPNFVSVTYGAGGTTRDTTKELVVEINERHPFAAMPHLTCIGHLREDLESLVTEYRAAGIHNILALAGDPPADGSPAIGDLTYASELIELIRGQGEFCVGVAAFPEGHPRSASIREDRRRLAEKLMAADFGITQFFFRASDYFRMVEDLAALGCDRPVIPGLIPLVEPASVRRFAEMNGAYFPEDQAAAVLAADPEDRVAVAVEFTAALAAELVEGGAPGLHIYCLNRAAPALGVVRTVESTGWAPVATSS